jgi:aminopeptidase-like protein
MEQTINTYFEFVRAIELNDYYKTTIPYCEPQLGKRGLYPDSVLANADRKYIHRLMHLLSFADGNNDLIEIAELRGESIFDYKKQITTLVDNNILTNEFLIK